MGEKKNGEGKGGKYLEKANFFAEEKEKEGNIRRRKIFFRGGEEEWKRKKTKISWRKKNVADGRCKLAAL